MHKKEITRPKPPPPGSNSQSWHEDHGLFLQECPHHEERPSRSRKFPSKSMLPSTICKLPLRALWLFSFLLFLSELRLRRTSLARALCSTQSHGPQPSNCDTGRASHLTNDLGSSGKKHPPTITERNRASLPVCADSGSCRVAHSAAGAYLTVSQLVGLD